MLNPVTTYLNPTLKHVLNPRSAGLQALRKAGGFDTVAGQCEQAARAYQKIIAGARDRDTLAQARGATDVLVGNWDGSGEAGLMAREMLAQSLRCLLVLEMGIDWERSFKFAAISKPAMPDAFRVVSYNPTTAELLDPAWQRCRGAIYRLTHPDKVRTRRDNKQLFQELVRATRRTRHPLYREIFRWERSRLQKHLTESVAGKARANGLEGGKALLFTRSFF